ncbi:MAG: M28 family peptidase [Gemmatimonadota bacterium]|nr:M28 family peptidase [Gemmatimonadota bacterium]
MHTSRSNGRAVLAIVSALGLAGAYACASVPMVPPNEFGNPVRLRPTPTVGEINVADLRTRLYIFADDSMQGRQFGREGNMKGTAYIAAELQRMGVEPAGDNGTYFQELPVVQRKFARSSTLSVNGKALRWVEDWIAAPGPRPREVNGVEAIFGGTAGDTANFISADQARGKLVLVRPAPAAAAGAAPAGGRGGGGGAGGGRGGGAGAQAAPLSAAQVYAQRIAGAAGIISVNLDGVRPAQRAFIAENPAGTLVVPQGAISPQNSQPQPAPPPPGPAQLRVTRAAADLMLGGSLDAARPGTSLGSVVAKLDHVETPVGQWGRNVVGIIRGSDPKLKTSFVALGAHPDHVGFDRNPVDHDSLKLFNAARQAFMNGAGELRPATAAQLASIKLNLDSVRKIRPPRPDSIRNGADDDGSGSMALLEIAEAVMAMPVKPKRSLLLVWNNGEEAGLLGSAWYTTHPTVPRDSIVAQINLDMIGRGRVADLPGGGDDYLAVVGSQRLSQDVGQAVIATNLKQPAPFRLDYRFDSTTTWPGYNNIYGRSDHANYARFNIPIAFFFTGLHADYHQLTDEPQYIDYPHYARITRYIGDVVLDLANREKRPALYKP